VRCRVCQLSVVNEWMNAMNGESSSPLQGSTKAMVLNLASFQKRRMQKVCQLSVTEWGSFKSLPL
jgi:hypothetical protein